MEWYLPMTIIPGIGLLILSTSNIMLSTNAEITHLLSDKEKYLPTIEAKLVQLKRLSVSIVFLYFGVLLFLFTGILKVLSPSQEAGAKVLLLLGVMAVTASILILLVHSVKAVSIRQKHLHL